MAKPMSQKAFLRKRGCLCPNCKDGDVEAGPMEVDGPSCYCPVWCLTCGANWNEIYRLEGYGELDIPA